MVFSYKFAFYGTNFGVFLDFLKEASLWILIGSMVAHRLQTEAEVDEEIGRRRLILTNRKNSGCPNL